MEKVIGVGEYVVSDDVEDVLKIYGLGSCIGLVMYCPDAHVLGVAHILLPSSQINLELGKISPAYFVDTGIDAMLKSICTDYGCLKQNIITYIYGGAEASRSGDDMFNIGSRNIDSAKQKLREHQLKFKECDTGGKFSRTIEVKVIDGAVKLTKRQYNIL